MRKKKIGKYFQFNSLVERDPTQNKLYNQRKGSFGGIVHVEQFRHEVLSADVLN